MEPSIEKLHEVFKTMVCGENSEDTSQANAWFETIEIVDKSTEINDILKSVKVYKPVQSHLLRLAEEIEKNSTLISQIEVLSRGVLAKDTKQAVGSLAQYFYYYACYVEENREDKVKAAVGVFENDHPLWMLGLFLGPALATGHSVILHVGTKFAAVVTFIVSLAVKIGISEGSLQVVPSCGGELQPYFAHKNVVMVALFVDAFSDKYRAFNRFNKKILILSAYKSPMLVFDSADLDSAVESTIGAAWGYQGMLPWSIDTVLVQENVFKTYVEKLKIRLESVRIGNGNDRLADISFPSNPNFRLKLSQLIDKAKLLGVEVYQKAGDGNFTPTLIIGSRVNTNNVVSSPDINCALTLLPFRSIDEAVNLANNTRQGLGASVWSENVGLLNEVAVKLKTGNVWFNSHGLFCPAVSFKPLKDSGVGYFGGKQGLTEFNNLRIIEIPSTLDLPTTFKTVDSVKSSISAGQKASASWSKFPPVDKLKTFVQLADFLQTNRKQFCEKLPESWVDGFITNLRCVTKLQTGWESFILKGFTVNVFECPRGVVAIEMNNPLERHHVKLLLAALLSGNAVLLINETSDAQGFYQELSKKLPSGLLSVVPYSLDAVHTSSRHKELNGYYATNSLIYGMLPVDESKLFNSVLEDFDWTQISSLVTTTKNVWSNVGQSSQCSL